jgi:hypothetical protein
MKPYLPVLDSTVKDKQAYGRKQEVRVIVKAAASILLSFCLPPARHSLSGENDV